MKTLRLTVACLLFVLSLAVIIPQSQHARSARGAGAATHPAPASSRAASNNLALAPQVAGTIVRTLAYHQITDPIPNFAGGLLSANGQRVVYVQKAQNQQPPRITVINADGSGQPTTINALATVVDLDISADASKIIYAGLGGGGVFEHGPIYIADASGNRILPGTENIRGIDDVRISGDGTKVFFRLVRSDGQNPEKGYYVVNSDGSNRPRQIVGPSQLAPLIGLSPTSDVTIGPANNNGTSLAVSADGSQVVFVNYDQAGNAIFAVSLAGQGLHRLIEGQQYSNVSLSGDGKKAHYFFVKPSDGSRETGVINFDGTGRHFLVNTSLASPHFVTGFNFEDLISDLQPLNTDGSKLLLGSTGVLMDTLTGSPLELSIGGDNQLVIPDPLVADGLTNPSMNSSATRFLYRTGEVGKDPELAILDLNPSNLGAAPSITQPTIDPPFVLTNGRSNATITAKVSTSSTIKGVGNFALYSGAYPSLLGGLNTTRIEGLYDRSVPSPENNGHVMLDDGKNGDGAAGDGVYGNNRIFASNDEPVGSRLIRVTAEVRASDGRRHATAIDFESLTVTDQAPLIDVSPTSLDFGDVNAGQSRDLPLTVRNIGANQLTINSITSDNQRFTVPSLTTPLTIAAGGQQTITVRFSPTAAGEQRGTLTINSTDPARPSVTVALSGNGVSLAFTVTNHVTTGAVSGACNPPPTAKTSFATTDARVFQFTSGFGAKVGDLVRWEFVQPNGSVYAQSPLTLDRSGDICFWTSIDIAGQPAASLPGNWQVRVFYNGTLIVTDNFTISAPVACPTISGLNPTSAPVGSSVTITGANFTGVTAVKFANSIAAQFNVTSDTSLTATVPSGAVSGPITLSKSGCADVPSSTTFTVSTGPCITVSISSNLAGAPGGTLTVPILVSDMTGRSVLSYDATLTFDPNVLRLQSSPTDKTGTLSSALAITTNTGTPGQLRLSGFGTSPLAGAGTLLNLKFDVVGAVSACSNLTWVSFKFNEGNPCATTSNGRACAAGGSFAGAVNYCIQPKPVPGVLVSASGSPSANTTTNSAGTYQLPNLSGGPYTLTPSKTGDANGITSFDAALVAQHVVGLITLNACQQLAGDTSNDGSISSFDAALIAQFAVGINNPASIAGTWKFTPPNRTYSTLAGDQTNQNFDAVLVGEVSGNWVAGGSSVQAKTETPGGLIPNAIQVPVSLPDTSATPGASLTLPITVGDLTGKGIISFDFDLTFDPNVLQAQNPPVDAAGTLSSNLTITPNPTSGRLRVSAFGTTALAGAGTLLKLKFNVVGAAGSSTPLTWQKFLFNEDAQTGLTNGRVSVTSTITIDVSPTSLDFASVTAGQTKDLTLTVRNTGNGPLTVNSFASSNARFTAPSPATPFTVAAGSQQTVTVRFAPTGAGVQTSTLSVNSNASNLPSASVSLVGNGVAAGNPAIAATPATLDFGTVALGQSLDRTFTISNPGNGVLSLFATISSNPQFNVVLPTIPLNINPGASATLTARFTPTAGGTPTATLVISSNATDKATFPVQLRGEVPGGQPTETLSTDDGSAETGTTQDGLLIVNRLTPTRLPATLRTIRIFIAQFQGLPSPVGEQIRLIAFADPSGSGQPPNNPQLLVNQMVTIPSIPTNGGFIDFTIQSSLGLNAVGETQGLTIDQGDIYVGYQVLRPARGVVFAADSSGPQRQRAFFSTNDGSNFTQLMGLTLQPGTLTPVNIMIQATLSGTGICTYVITPNNQAFGEGGGSGSAQVTAPAGCNWAVNSTASWVNINPTYTGTGNGTVNFSVPPNASPRRGNVSIAGLNFTVAQAEKVVSVSSASYSGLGLAVEAIASAFGTSLATASQSATSLPLPTSLAGTTVKIKDAAGAELLAPLFFVSPGQINFLVPPGLAPGTATVTVTNSNGGTAIGIAQNDAVAPGLFSANADGQGVPAAVALRYKSDGSASVVDVFQFNAGQGRFLPLPLDLGPEGDQVFLVLFGTGIRNRTSLGAVSVKIGGAEAQVTYAGPQGGFVGLDQINVLVPRSLVGRGEVDVVLTADGRAANPVRVNIK